MLQVADKETSSLLVGQGRGRGTQAKGPCHGPPGVTQDCSQGAGSPMKTQYLEVWGRGPEY